MVAELVNFVLSINAVPDAAHSYRLGVVVFDEINPTTVLPNPVIPLA